MLAAVRILTGLPLLVFGVMHYVVPDADLRPLLEGAGVPWPALGATIIPAIQILAGLVMVSGFAARLGGLVALATMLGALYTHLVFDWPGEPPVGLPLVVLAGAGLVLWRGSGAWSWGHRSAVV